MEIEAIHTDSMEGRITGASVGEVVLSANGLTKAFGGNVVLDNISFDLRQGEVVLLRGENGSGKTTLLNILTGNLEPDSGEIHLSINSAREVFIWPRRWWQDLNPFDHFTPERIAWEGVGRVWQDIRLFPTMTALDNVALASPKQSGENPIMALLRLGHVNKEGLNHNEEAGRWLNGLGLGDRLDSSCDKISLGQMKRVAIARAVQAGAKVLFLDEPISGLDGKGVVEVMRYLDTLVNTNNLTIVIVEHVFNIHRVLDLATTVWTLDGGHLKVESKDDVKRRPDTRMDSDLKDWLKEVAGPDGSVETHEFVHGARLTTVAPKGTEDAPIVLEACGLVVKRGYRTVLDGLSLSLRKGQLVLLEAPNGWGKSTLFDAIAGIYPIQSGRIFLNDQRIDNLPTDKRINRGLSYLRTQQPAFGSLSIAEHKKLSSNDKDVFDNLPDSDKKVDLLSGGQKQKIMIEMLPKSDVYLLDEPFIGLDKEAIERVIDSIQIRMMESKAILITIPMLG
ncbi:MAG: sugar ABC transporter ATP-binding protein [Ignavibacteriales bacterium]|nr:sugar ABC transporter ATP-binding protein [Ignavibacteriales bacterium]